MVKRFEWDPRKAERTRAERSLNFEDATKLFLYEAQMQWWRDRRQVDEYRYVGLGFIGARLFHVVWVLRNGFFRIVQFRKASKDEQQEYFELKATGKTRHRRGKKTTRPFYRNRKLI